MGKFSSTLYMANSDRQLTGVIVNERPNNAD